MTDYASSHSFQPIRVWDRRPGGRCRHCYLPRRVHPVGSRVPSRALGDKRPAERVFIQGGGL